MYHDFGQRSGDSIQIFQSFARSNRTAALVVRMAMDWQSFCKRGSEAVNVSINGGKKQAINAAANMEVVQDQLDATVEEIKHRLETRDREYLKKGIINEPYMIEEEDREGGPR